MWYNSKNASKIKSKIIIVEGFDFTGKSYFIEKFSKLHGYKLWEPKYDSDLNNKVLPYNDRYSLGMGLIDLVESKIVDTKVIVNRGLPSGIVYNNMYHQSIPTMINKEFYDYALKKYSNPKLIHTIYIAHTDIKNARLIYENSQKRNGNESYDEFGSFENYVKLYNRFHKQYMMALKSICKDNFTVLSSMTLEEVEVTK